MLKNTAKAKRLFEEENHCLVICKADKTVVSDKSGTEALLRLIEENGDLKNCCCACKLVGRSTAILFAKAQIREIYCEAISCDGKSILAKNGISVYYHTLTDVYSCEKDDCPIEKAVENVTNPELGFELIKSAVK